MLSPENGSTSRPASGDGRKPTANVFIRRRHTGDKLGLSPGKPSLGLPTAAQVAPFTLHRSLSGRMRPERNGPEDSEGEVRKRKTSFGASCRSGASQKAEERAGLRDFMPCRSSALRFGETRLKLVWMWKFRFRVRFLGVR